ncbi:hypothetical protein Y032_0036g3230 [Ancylostoma ceylanicum]|uniref:BPTI/Kunitz inhibitor domain-containing protein n=1 Tax=Ancylostoma ceylanicum TaxID=53326 RepID=A0A016UJQ2_9BILA|nr:hypothetical protein Y032_0036g3230 [Ancylostoma ceylanicum]
MLPPLLCELLLLTGVLADYLVAPRVVNSVNYDDFSLLCADGIPLLMEDHRPRPCHPRPWLREQKCPTGFWCHEGDEESSYYCCPRNRKFANQCHLPPVVGHGKKAMRRFYYDWSSDGCHELTYTGLGGNENSFLSYEQCENTCRGAGEPTVAVPEDAMLSKNKKVTKTPASTSPTTTESSTNSSSSETATTSTAKETTASTKARPESTTIRSSTPRTTIAGERTTKTATTTRSAVENPVVTTSQVTTSEHGEELPTTRWMGTNPCEKTPDKGRPGGVAQKMWYFDESTLSCQPFTYLGSGGNANRFVDREMCMRVCGSGFSGRPSQASCDLPPQFGNGTFKIPRYFFDKMTKQCELFFFSGDGGNENRFLKKQKCERLCVGKKNKKQSTPVATTTMGTRPATRTFQELHSTQSLPMSSTTSTPTSEEPHIPEPEPSPAVPSVAPVEATTAEPFPTLINVPREFVPPFPQFTLLPADNAPNTPSPQNHPQKVLTEPPPNGAESIDSIFERLMTSSPAPPIVTAAPAPPSPIKEIGKSHSTFGVPPELIFAANGGGSGLPGFVATAAPAQKGPGLWRTRSPPSEMPILPVVAVTKEPTVNMPRHESGLASLTDTYSPYNPTGLTATQPQLPPAVIYVPNPNASPNSAPVTSQEVRNITGQYSGLSTDVVASPGFSQYVNAQNPGLAHKSEWVEHGIRAFQQVMQQHLTSTMAPFGAEFVPNTAPDIIAETPVPAEKAPLTGMQQPELPVVATLPQIAPTVMQEVESAPAQPDKTLNASDVWPCHAPIFDDVVIMCALEEVTCPKGSFCQIGDGQSICCPVLAEPVCRQPLRHGVGPSSLIRWYFDAVSKQCLPFSFRGFQGNQNNFESFAQCESACVTPVLCEGGVAVPFTNANGSCSPFSANSCPSGSFCKVNGEYGTSACCAEPPKLPGKYSTVSDSERFAANCFLAQDAGFGVESSHRWSFDASSSDCVSFIYNGYGGNQNNFLSRRDCESACKMTRPCDEPVSSGYGNKFISRFFYSREYGQCLHFVYSGEGGNTNNFPNLRECMKTCMPDSPQFKSHPPNNEPTLAFAFISRPICPHGDVATNGGVPVLCDAATGTGCPAGNVCTPMEMGAYCCQAPESFCLQPRPAMSPCLSQSSLPLQQVEFTYDPMADRCVPFTYSSCSPSLNLNHFASSSQCMRLCCNQGYDLMYKRRLLMNDSPLESSEESDLP